MSSVKLICKYCKIVKRNKIIFITCKNYKHKQRQG